MEITWVNSANVRIPRSFLLKWVTWVIKELNKHQKFEVNELTLVFVTAQKMRALNRRYRSRDYATDVLSFGVEEPEAAHGCYALEGELVLCPSVIRRQAKEHGLTFNEEIGYMVLHGILHLLGFEHEHSKAKAQAMFELQDEVFEAGLARFGDSVQSISKKG